MESVAVQWAYQRRVWRVKRVACACAALAIFLHFVAKALGR